MDAETKDKKQDDVQPQGKTPAVLIPPGVSPMARAVLEVVAQSTPEDIEALTTILALYALEYDLAAKQALERNRPLDLTGALVRASRSFPPNARLMALRVFPALALRLTPEMREALHKKTAK